MKHKRDTKRMVLLGMLIAVLLVMGTTGIGFIPLPVIKATTMHIPVILGAVLLGPTAGAILGGAFGFCSIWTNTVTPGLLSFAFSPLMSTTGFPGMVKSVWVALGCRILFGWLAGWIWKLLKKLKMHDFAALPTAAAVSSICHTLLVMGSIYVLFAQQYAEAKNVAGSAVFGLVMGTVTASGIPEAIAAAVLVTAVGKALLQFIAAGKKR